MVSLNVQRYCIPFVASTSITATPISMVTEILEFAIEVQCQSDVLSESLIIMVNSTAYIITRPSLISKFTTTISQTGYDISIQCIWNVNGGMIIDETTLYGNDYFYHFNCIC